MSGKKSRRPVRRRPKKARSAPGRQNLKILLASLFLVGFLLAALVLLGELRRSYHPPQEEPPVATVGVELLEDVEVELESALLRSGASLDRLQTIRSGEMTRLVVAGGYPPDAVLEELRQRLSRLSDALQLQAEPAGGLLTVSLRGTPRFEIRFEPPPATQPQPHRPRVAIIIDDLGRDLGVARDLLAIDQPFTFAILPNDAHTAQIATLAHRRGREVMIHIPMEPQGYPATDPGKNALFVDLPAQEIRRRFLSYLDQVPYAKGGNNHMGSRFTTDVAGMRTVLEAMKQEGMFVSDSRTTGNTIAGREAQELGVPTLSRDVFLDNVADVGQISQQIRKLVELAGKRGYAVGICHPYRETVQALRQEAGGLLSQGVVLVPVSKLLKD